MVSNHLSHHDLVRLKYALEPLTVSFGFSQRSNKRQCSKML